MTPAEVQFFGGPLHNKVEKVPFETPPPVFVVTVPEMFVISVFRYKLSQSQLNEGVQWTYSLMAEDLDRWEEFMDDYGIEQEL